MFTRNFWKAAVERAVKTFAQSLLALLSASQLGLLDVDWVTVLSTAAMAAVLSLLSSIGSLNVGAPDDPSALHTETSPVASEQPPPRAAAA